MAKLTKCEGNHGETAHLLGISPPALTKAVRDRGCPVKRRGGRGRAAVYSWKDVIAWRKADLAPSALEAANTRRYTALAEKTEAANDARRRELVESAEIRRCWAKLC